MPALAAHSLCRGVEKRYDITNKSSRSRVQFRCPRSALSSKESDYAWPFKTSNPALNENTFDGRVAVAGEAMTLQGTVNKTGVLLFCVVITSAWTWGIAHSQAPEAALPWMMGGLVGGLVFAW